MGNTLDKMANRLARRYTDGPTVATIPNPTVDASAIDENNNKNVFRKFPEINNISSDAFRTVISGPVHTDNKDRL
jgi:hypothetical protein